VETKEIKKEREKEREANSPSKKKENPKTPLESLKQQMTPWHSSSLLLN
jgi:hypothetical protein